MRTVHTKIMSRWSRRSSRLLFLEPLESRQLLAADFFLEIDGIKGESSDAKFAGSIEIEAFQWGAADGSVKPGGVQLTDKTVQDFHFVTHLSSATPKLLQSVATGQHHKSAVLHIRNDDNQEYLQYKLTDVLISGVQHRSLNEELPREEIAINFGRVEETFRKQNADGSLGAPVKTSWDVAQDNVFSTAGPHILPQHPSPNLDQLDVFLKLDGIQGGSADAKHKNEIQIESFSWGVSNTGAHGAGGGGGAGKVALQDFHFVADSSKASPLLALSAATGQHLPKGIIAVRKAGETQDFFQIKLEDILISSYQVQGNTESIPVDSFSLNFSKINIDYKPQKPDGSLGNPIKFGAVNTFDTGIQNVFVQGQELLDETVRTSLIASQEYFLKLDGVKGESADAKHKNEIEIESFSWGVANVNAQGGGAGKAQFQDFHFTSPTGAASPLLFAANYDGKHLPKGILAIRNPNVGQDYIKIDFTDVLISGYHLRSLNEAVPTDQFSLNFSKIGFEYKPQNPDGSLGAPIEGGVQVPSNTEWVVGPNLFQQQGNTQAAVDAFLEIEGVKGESADKKHKESIDIQSWSWGESLNRETNSSNDLLWHNFHVVTNMSKASPQLFNALASGKSIPNVTLLVRKPGFADDYLTIKLSDVELESHRALTLNNGEPLEEVSFHFNKLSFAARGESQILIGLLLPAVQKVREAAERVKFEIGPELIGLTHTTPGNTNLFLKLTGVQGNSTDALHKGEIEIESFSWGLSNPSAHGTGGGGGAGKVSMQDIHFVLNSSSLSPALAESIFTGKQWMNAVLSIRRPNGSYVQIKLEDVLVSSFNTQGRDNTTPLDEVSLNFGKVTETFLAKTRTGELVPAGQASWNNWTTPGNYSFGPSIIDQTTPSAAAVDYLLEIEGVKGESNDHKHKGAIEIESFSWGATRTIDRTQQRQSGKVSVHDIQITKTTDSTSPLLLRSITDGSNFGKATLSLRKAGQRIDYLQYELENILVSSYQTSASGDVVPTDQLSLNFSKIKFITPQVRNSQLESIDNSHSIDEVFASLE